MLPCLLLCAPNFYQADESIKANNKLKLYHLYVSNSVYMLAIECNVSSNLDYMLAS